MDDLFDVVSAQTVKAEEIRAVDVEISRWTDDERAEDYEEQNRIALGLGAKIYRIYVVSPKIEMTMMDKIERRLIHHLSFNDELKVKRANGELEIRGIDYLDLPDPDAPQDFAIFGPDKVLFEEFNADWNSTFKGGSHASHRRFRLASITSIGCGRVLHH